MTKNFTVKRSDYLSYNVDCGAIKIGAAKLSPDRPLPMLLRSVVWDISESSKLSELRFYLVKHPPDAVLAEANPFGPFPGLLEPGDVLPGIRL